MYDKPDAGARFAVGAFFTFLSAILVALGILGLQVFWYFKEGVWTALSLLDGVVWLAFKFDPTFANDGSWLIQPTTWLGVHKVLAGAPLSLSVLLIGVLIGWIAVKVAEH